MLPHTFSFAVKSATQLIEAIHQSKSTTFDRWLIGLGIRHVGNHVAKLLAQHFCSLDNLMRATQENLQEILLCTAQLKGALEHFASKRAFNIEGFGKKTVAQLVTHALVSDLSGIFGLTVDQISRLDGFAVKSATQLIEAIHQSKSTTFDRWLIGLGIRHVGNHVAKLLAQHFCSLDNLMRATQENLQEIPGVGSEIAASVVQFFAEPRNVAVIQHMIEKGVKVQEIQNPLVDKHPSLAGQTFVLTGGLKRMTRQEAKERIETHGGRVTSSVSKQTSFVIEGHDPGSKLVDANRLGIPVLKEAQLEELLAGLEKEKV